MLVCIVLREGGCLGVDVLDVLDVLDGNVVVKASAGAADRPTRTQHPANHIRAG